MFSSVKRLTNSSSQTVDFITKYGLIEHPRIFAIQLKDGDVVGYCIFGSYGNDVTTVELGWILAEEHWSKGLASEVTKELLLEAKNSGYSKAIIEFDKNNIASQKIAKKFNFKHFATENNLEIYDILLK